MTNKKICIKCDKEFTPKQDWMVICPECFKNMKKKKYFEKVEENKKEMNHLSLDPLNSTTLDFGVYKGYNLFQIYYVDRGYFKYLLDYAYNPEFGDRNKNFRKELINLEKKLYKYVVKECFKILRKSLSNNEAVYAKGIHAVGIEYGIDGQFYIQQILSNNPKLFLCYNDDYFIGIILHNETFFNLLSKLHNITNGGYSEYNCYTVF